MSIDNVDIRDSILKSVRKSASVDYNSESIREPSNHSEHRTKFLECREQFERPPPQIEKVPFLPHWVNPEYDTNLHITYKKRGNVITDVRINLLNNGNRENHEMDSRMEFENPAYITSAETLPKEDDLGSDRNPKLLGFITNDHSLRTASEELRVMKRRMNRHNRHVRSNKRFQPLGIIEEQTSVDESNRTVDTFKKSPSTFPTTDSASARICEPIVYRPIVRKAIELKKYDHIVTNVIRNEK